MTGSAMGITQIPSDQQSQALSSHNNARNPASKSYLHLNLIPQAPSLAGSRAYIN